MAVPSDSILYAKSHASDNSTDYGERQVWVYGDKQMRWLEADSEEVFAEGKGTTRRLKGKVETVPDMRMVPNEIFRAGALLEAAKSAKGVDLTEDGDATSCAGASSPRPPHWPTIEMTMWLDKDTYAPLKFTDHSWGKDVEGKAFDRTYTETILDFKTLPATPENLKQLDLAVVAGVLVERAVDLEAGAHRARSGIRIDVDVDVRRRRVGGARVEEELQVLALAALHEQLGQVAGAVEREVPHARVAAQAVEDAGAGERRVGQDEVRELVAVGLRVGVGDHQADVVAGEDDLPLDPEVVAQEALDVRRHRALVVAARRLPRVAGAAVVGRDDAEARLGEVRDHAVPLPPRLREPVQQDERARAVALGHVVQSQSGFDVSHAVRHGLQVLRKRQGNAQPRSRGRRRWCPHVDPGL